MKLTKRIFFLTFFLSLIVHFSLLAQNKMIAKQDAVKKVVQKKVAPQKIAPKKIMAIKPTKVVAHSPVQKPKLAQVLSPQPKDSSATSAQIKSKTEVANASFTLFTTNAGSVSSDDFMILKEVNFSSTDYLFYLLVGMFLLLGLVRTTFPKYFNDLFALFFQSTFKQKSIREQLSQTTIPSFLLNILFFFSAGFFLYILTGYYQLHVAQTFEGNLGIWVVVLILVYVSKLLLIKLLGWIFQLQEACQIYNFIVFMMNKVMGVALLPFLLLLCFGPVDWRPVVITISFFLIAAMLTYRYIIAYPAVRPSVRLNRFHFFIYLCTFEIIPFALIYRELTAQFLQKT